MESTHFCRLNSASKAIRNEVRGPAGVARCVPCGPYVGIHVGLSLKRLASTGRTEIPVSTERPVTMIQINKDASLKELPDP
jgi:hypothetical protein